MYPKVSILEVWNLYSDVLWDEGRYKNTARTFVDEMNLILMSYGSEIIDKNVVDLLVSSLRRAGNKNSTINRKLAVFYKLARKAHDMGIINKVPAYLRLKEGNARIRFLSDHEETLLFESIRARSEDHYRLCNFLVDTGARVGEALSTNWADYTRDSVTFWITKSGRSRTVPLTQKAKTASIDQTGKRGPGPFRSVDYQRFRADWLAARREVGLDTDKQVVPHILRHTCASRLVQAGIDLRRVQTFLGHQSIQMTLRYAHLSTSDLNQCVLALESRLA